MLEVGTKIREAISNQVLVVWDHCYGTFLAFWIVTRDSSLTAYKCEL